MTPTLRSLAIAFAAALPLAAQTLPEGYQAQARPLPAGTTHVVHLSGTLNGATATFDGTTLWFAGLGLQRPLLTLPAPVFGSFLVQIDSNRLLFGESSTGAVWTVPLNGAPPVQPIASIAFNYDAAMLTPQLAIVSAKTGGFASPDNDLIALDVTTGNQQLLAQVPGASGPVTVDGALYYATSSLLFPTPPGQTSILRFGRSAVLQALNSSQVLGASHAQVVFAGLDSASAIAIDRDHDLLFVDWMQNVIGEIDDIHGPAPTRKNLVDYGSATVTPVALQLVRNTTLAAFEPFQPFGGMMHVHESDFGTTTRVRNIRSRRAELTASASNPIPSGPFTLDIAYGPASGAGLIAIALPGGAGMQTLPIAGFEQPLFWHAGLLQPANTHFVTFDSAGSASLALTNPGFAPGQPIAVQAAFVDAATATIGATAHRILHLTQ